MVISKHHTCIILWKAHIMNGNFLTENVIQGRKRKTRSVNKLIKFQPATTACKLQRLRKSFSKLFYDSFVRECDIFFKFNGEIHRKGEYILAIVKPTKIFQSLYLIKNCSLKSFIFFSLGKSMIWLQQTAANVSNAWTTC